IARRPLPRRSSAAGAVIDRISGRGHAECRLVDRRAASAMVPNSPPTRGEDHNEVNASLDAKSVLVIEDQFLIAIDAEQALRQAGAADVRLASSVRDALLTLAHFVPDAAVLDFNLGDGT